MKHTVLLSFLRKSEVSFTSTDSGVSVQKSKEFFYENGTAAGHNAGTAHAQKREAKELAERFGVFMQTIYRETWQALPMRECLSPASQSTATVIASCLDTVDTRLFSDADFAILLSDLEGAGTIMPDVSTGNALARLLSQLPAGKDERIRKDVRAIRLDFSPDGVRPLARSTFSLIRPAVENRQLLAFDYMNRHNEESRRVNPIPANLRSTTGTAGRLFVSGKKPSAFSS